MNSVSGKSAFLSLLEDEGITHLFGNPGTTELPIMDALSDHPGLTYVLGLQEAAVVAMADGFARASGQLAACNVHVAPGLGNALGSLFNAYWFGSPVLITAGQQEIGHGLTEPMLYGPMVAMASPLVKWAIEVQRLADLPRIVRRAAKVALTPPTGPVFLSLPGDILNQSEAVDLGQRTRVNAASRPSDEDLASLAERLLCARAPVLIAGHELATRDALDEAARLAELLGAPAYQQTVPYGSHFHSEHPAFMGALTRVQRQVHDTLAPYDVLVCLGADVLRMSVPSDTDPLPPDLPIVQIAERDWELGKNYPAEVAVRADVKQTLAALCGIIERRRSAEHAAAAARRLEDVADSNWSASRNRRRAQTLSAGVASPIDPDFLMLRIAEALPPNAVVVDEGLTSSQALLSFLPFTDARSYFGLASGGIGFAIAGALGIHLALPQRPMLAVIGDGSAMYNIQALWTAAHMQLPITFVIANNRGYRILRQRLDAFHGNRNFVGMEFHQPELDFVGLATAFGLEARRVTASDDVAPALEAALSSGRPTLLDVAVSEAL